MKVSMGNHELEIGGKYVTELRSSNDIMDDIQALQQRMSEEGYLFIRGFHDRDKVMSARMDILNKMQLAGKLDPEFPIEQGRIGAENKRMFWGGANHDSPRLLELVNSFKVMDFFDRFLGGPSMTYDFKWPRAVPKGDFTGAHYDVVYMGRGTKNVYTVWTPLGDISYETGGLALCLGSQHFEKLKKTYGEMDVDRDNVMGWFSNDPIEIIEKFGGQWATAEFKAGDALIFGMYLMHASMDNTTDYYRLSVDTRYQLSSEPADERWIGLKPKAHYAWGKGETISMEKAREKWGVD